MAILIYLYIVLCCSCKRILKLIPLLCVTLAGTVKAAWWRMRIESVVFLSLQLLMSAYHGGYNFFCQDTHSGGEADHRVTPHTDFDIVWDLEKCKLQLYSYWRHNISSWWMCACAVKLAAPHSYTLGETFRLVSLNCSIAFITVSFARIRYIRANVCRSGEELWRVISRYNVFPITLDMRCTPSR